MAKQTSVDYLEAWIKPLLGGEGKKLFEQAKKMHREEMEAAYGYGVSDAYNDERGKDTDFANAQDYYQKTYGKEGKGG